MGNFYLRMPKSKTQPASWRLISSQLHGPYADGLLNLSTDNGWAAHCGRNAPDAELFQFRNRGNKEWLPACYMSTSKNFMTLQFEASPIVNTAGSANYNVPLGWNVSRDVLYEIWDPIFIDGHAVFFESTQREDETATAWGQPGAHVPLTRYVSGVAGSLSSVTLCGMGWIGNEDGTISRYRADTQSWYALPIGAVLEQAETMKEIQKINGVDWAQNAQLLRLEIDFNMNGWSVDKSQLPWMNSYTSAFTTNAFYPGVGAIRQIGNTSPDNLVTYTLNGTIPNTSTSPFAAGLFTSPAVRDRPYGREDGDLIWAGNLNDLGHRPASFGVTAPHGLPTQPSKVVTQILDIVSYDVRDAITYQIQLSDVPDPDAISSNYYRAIENYMYVTVTMRVVYAF